MLLKEVTKLLFKTKKTISVAESCTGGLISHSLTNISGSSKYFRLGLVLYSNHMKSNMLKISPKMISKFGAVSKEVALLMAKNIKAVADTDIGISATGIAGPLGGNKTKPLGTVFIAISYKNKSLVKRFHFQGNRLQIKNKTKNQALLLIKKCLKKP